MKPGASASAQVSALVVNVAEALQERFGDLSREMTDAIMEHVGGLDDAETHNMLHASVEANIETILHVLRNHIPVANVRPSTAAVEYAYRLARLGVPGDALRRAYHIGSEVLRTWAFSVLTEQEATAEVQLHAHFHIEGFIYEYIDDVTQAVLAAHAQESRRVADSTATQTIELLRRVLDGGDVSSTEFESGTGYRLMQHHRGAILWISDPQPGLDHTSDLRRAADQLARLYGLRRLFATVDRETAWVWFAEDATRARPTGAGRKSTNLPDDRSAPTAPVGDTAKALSSALEEVPGIGVALGSLCRDVAGFRKTHQQARAAKRVAMISARTQWRGLSYETPGVAIAALLADDIGRLRGWVAEQLGGLANDSELAERLRGTLRVFIESDRSHTRTGTRLTLHRNTVKYRVDKALEILGNHGPERTGDLLMALTLCDLFGAVVLQETPE